MYKIILPLLFVIACSALKAQTITTVAGFKGSGTAANELYDPAGIFVDDSGYLYVADLYNNRIQKFPPNSAEAANGVTVAGGNGYGSDSDQLAYPNDVFVDDSGNIYVADEFNNRIQKFPPNGDTTTNGVTVAGGDSAGSATYQLDGPAALYVDDSGNIYVADYFNDRVLKFPPNSTSGTKGAIVAGGNGAGSAANQLNQPNGLFLDTAGNIYVSDFNNYRIQKFPPGSTSSTNGVTVAGGNGYGSNANQLADASAIFVDRNGSIYVADAANNRVQKFPPGSTADSNAVTVAGGNGNGNDANQLSGPDGVYVNGSGYVYVSDYYNDRIQKWSPVLTGISYLAPNTEHLALYPNPNDGTFLLETTNMTGQQYTIYDMPGNKVWQDVITTDKQVVDVKSLVAGMYMLRIGNSVLKLMVE